MSKLIKYLSYILLGLSAILAIAFYAVPKGDIASFETMSNSGQFLTLVLLYFTYILFFAALILAIGLPLMNLLSNPQGLKKILYSIILVVVVFGFAFMISSGKPLDAVVDPAPSALTLKITDTGLIVTYILAAVSVITIIGGGIINMVKNR